MGSYRFAPRLILMLAVIAVPLLSVIAPPHAAASETDAPPKNPQFAEKAGLVTGLIIPGFGLFSAMMLGEVGQPDAAIFTLLIGVLIPPLGNVYAGEFNLGIMLLYGLSAAAGTAGVVLFYSPSSQAVASAPPLFAIFYGAGMLLRTAAGLWDWLTASETAVRTNKERGRMQATFSLSPVLDVANGRIGLLFERRL